MVPRPTLPLKRWIGQVPDSRVRIGGRKGRSDGGHLREKTVEIIEGQLAGSIDRRFFGSRMDFDEEGIHAHGRSGPGQGGHEFPIASRGTVLTTGLLDGVGGIKGHGCEGSHPLQ